MKKFELVCEHTPQRRLEEIRSFCKENKIRVNSMKMDEIFTNQACIRISGETKRVANKVQKFIHEKINNGAYCSVEPY